jgi:hypothetical protein
LQYEHRKDDMLNVFEWLAGRRRIERMEGAGLSLAIYLIDEFQERTFSFKGLKNKCFGLSRENLLKQIQEELNSMLILYRYRTRVKKYTDRKGIPQVRIRLIGRAGMRSRYNPLDIEMDIKTETPNSR